MVYRGKKGSNGVLLSFVINVCIKKYVVYNFKEF